MAGVMADPIANDFAHIAQRMREIEQQRKGDYDCIRCHDGGWIKTIREDGWRTCPNCANPRGKTRPSMF
jgi:ribosomal protein L37AE/L43A